MPADKPYKTEMVSPICTYEDIPTIQEMVRQLRHKGAFSNNSCGIHIHVEAAPFDPRTLRNLVNIFYSKEDLLFAALKVDSARWAYCSPTDERFMQELNRKRPQTMKAFQKIWYGGEDGSNLHYHQSRYHALNLHSVFSHGTLEFRLFNSTVEHAGKIKADIQLCLAVCAQALTQRSASHTKTQTTNPAYTFRTWLLRLGMIGDEFATARKHLLENLEGNLAWRDPAQAERQRERMRQAALERLPQPRNILKTFPMISRWNPMKNRTRSKVLPCKCNTKRRNEFENKTLLSLWQQLESGPDGPPLPRFQGGWQGRVARLPPAVPGWAAQRPRHY